MFGAIGAAIKGAVGAGGILDGLSKGFSTRIANWIGGTDPRYHAPSGGGMMPTAKDYEGSYDQARDQAQQATALAVEEARAKNQAANSQGNWTNLSSMQEDRQVHELGMQKNAQKFQQLMQLENLNIEKARLAITQQQNLRDFAIRKRMVDLSAIDRYVSLNQKQKDLLTRMGEGFTGKNLNLSPKQLETLDWPAESGRTPRGETRQQKLERESVPYNPSISIYPGGAY